MSSTEIFFAFLPLVLYLGYIGLIPLKKRPRVVSGGGDFLLLAFGLMGLILLGPIKLVFPIAALSIWKIFTFPMVMMLYVLVSILISGAIGQKIIIYNIREEDFFDFLSREKQGDSSGSGSENEVQSDSVGEKMVILGNSVLIPRDEIQYTFEVQARNQVVIVRSTAQVPNLQRWFQLERRFRERFASVKTPISTRSAIRSGICVLPFFAVILLGWGPVLHFFGR